MDIYPGIGRLRTLPDQLTSRAPIGIHTPEQASGSPLAETGGFVVKFMNFWALEAPPGWSILFTHPFGSPTTPFRTLTGLVACDRYMDGYVHFPAIWTEPDYSGVIAAGTPIAQALPVKRDSVALTVETMDERQQAATRQLQEDLQAVPGVYRKRMRNAD